MARWFKFRLAGVPGAVGFQRLAALSMPVPKKLWLALGADGMLTTTCIPCRFISRIRVNHMVWTAPVFEEVSLCCEINSYVSAKL
jgi:coenzyme PQQ precursor peptide PqqA